MPLLRRLGERLRLRVWLDDGRHWVLIYLESAAIPAARKRKDQIEDEKKTTKAKRAATVKAVSVQPILHDGPEAKTEHRGDKQCHKEKPKDVFPTFLPSHPNPWQPSEHTRRQKHQPRQRMPPFRRGGRRLRFRVGLVHGGSVWAFLRGLARGMMGGLLILKMAMGT